MLAVGGRALLVVWGDIFRGFFLELELQVSKEEGSSPGLKKKSKFERSYRGKEFIFLGKGDRLSKVFWELERSVFGCQERYPLLEGR